MKNGADFTKTRQNSCPGVIFYDHVPFFTHTRSARDRRRYVFGLVLGKFWPTLDDVGWGPGRLGDFGRLFWVVWTTGAPLARGEPMHGGHGWRRPPWLAATPRGPGWLAATPVLHGGEPWLAGVGSGVEEGGPRSSSDGKSPKLPRPATNAMTIVTCESRCADSPRRAHAKKRVERKEVQRKISVPWCLSVHISLSKLCGAVPATRGNGEAQWTLADYRPVSGGHLGRSVS